MSDSTVLLVLLVWFLCAAAGALHAAVKVLGRARR